MLGLFTRKRHERAGFTLYNTAVAAARDPRFYTTLEIPDTLDGRFDLVGVHVFIIIDRLRAAPEPGPAIAQAVFDAMFADMDFNLREMGVGDMSVAKRMKEMWEAFHGRSQAYADALAADPATHPDPQIPDPLAEALRRNVWRGAAPEGAPATLAALVRHLREEMAAMPIAQFANGSIRFEAASAIPA